MDNTNIFHKRAHTVWRGDLNHSDIRALRLINLFKNGKNSLFFPNFHFQIFYRHFGLLGSGYPKKNRMFIHLTVETNSTTCFLSYFSVFTSANIKKFISLSKQRNYYAARNKPSPHVNNHVSIWIPLFSSKLFIIHLPM